MRSTASTVAAPVRVDVTRPLTRTEARAPSTMKVLTPIMVVVLVAYLIIGLAMPVLPLYVSKEPGGLGARTQFAYGSSAKARCETQRLVNVNQEIT